MKFVRFISVFYIAFVLSVSLGCSTDAGVKPEVGAPHSSAVGIADRRATESEKIVDFATGETYAFKAMDDYRNGAPFDCDWDKNNAVIADGILHMSVNKADDGYSGAEYRSRVKLGYGYYAVSMKAAAKSGVISSFFTYTGEPVQDEIDVEFLGKDTTKVQFNYYTNGYGGHEYVHELGFDASEDFHEYAFDWQKNSIVWYVDGKAVYKATRNIPSMPSEIIMNVWNGAGDGFNNWCGEFDGKNLPATAEYKWIAHKPNGGTLPPVPDDESTPPVKPDNPDEKPEDPDVKPVEPEKPAIAPDYFTADENKIANFANGGSNNFHAANNWTNGNMFDCYWYPDNIAFGGGNMTLSITRDSHRGYGYAAGEYRTNADYGFGYVSASIKAAKCDGTVTSLFTYTNTPRWDEIDIEILGKDTTKVQFNYYTNGKADHEYMHDLGFDASEGFHEYAFLWTSESIIWFVDGKAVYKATRDIPQYPGKIMVNLWNGIGVDEWLKPFDSSKLPVTAQYKWIGYKSL
ncbi:MAG: family 16 glycosylhydrolase [Clostridia bacterium]|nr:family 16 glycosylhydrolase [Clostridia bacterium]